MTPAEIKELEREVDRLMAWLDRLAPKPWDRETIRHLPEYLELIRNMETA